MLTVLVGLVYFRSNDLAQAHYILHQMFMPSEPLLSVPAWLAAMLPLDLPVHTFTLFAELRQDARFDDQIVGLRHDLHDHLARLPTPAGRIS